MDSKKERRIEVGYLWQKNTMPNMVRTYEQENDKNNIMRKCVP